MKLSPEQQNAVAQWVSGGAGPSEVQRRLEAELGLKMTFMEVRFLIDDLNLELVPPPPPAKPAKPAAATAMPGAKNELSTEPAEPLDAAAELDGGPVTVSVDTIKRPGAMLSGRATFGGGKSMGWQIDQFGRLGLLPSSDGFRPSPADLEEFQYQLQLVLRQKGMA